MNFLINSGVNESSVETSLGQPEYSYYFVASGFRKSLEQLGAVVEVSDPYNEVDKLCSELGGECVFLSFTPPHQAPVGLKCPTLCIFAWEFDTIPDSAWGDNPHNDWRVVLRDHGRTVTLATYSTAAVHLAMGADFPVASIPVPVWEDQAPVRALLEDISPLKAGRVQFNGDLVDSAEFNFESVESRAGTTEVPGWDGEPFTLQFDYNSPDVIQLNGFYSAEDWGAWSQSVTPTVELPTPLTGSVRVNLVGHGFHSNVGRELTVTLGSAKAGVILLDHPSEHELIFELTEPASKLSFRGLEPTPPPGTADRRTLGVGLVSLSFSRPGEDPARQPARSTQLETSEGGDQELDLEGVVYTSVFNPTDGRKNWIDMVTAFVWAHRDRTDATLVLKMVTSNLGAFIGTLRPLLAQLSPFKCRVVAIRAFLPDEEYRTLMANTSYYVNSSACEGLCLPLMEYMAAGIPAIAPDHTAMADYIDSDLAFVIDSTRQQDVWPHDPRDLFRTHSYRLNWETIRDAMEQSYQVAKHDQRRYRQMSDAAKARMQAQTSIEVVSRGLREFLELGR